MKYEITEYQPGRFRVTGPRPNSLEGQEMFPGPINQEFEDHDDAEEFRDGLESLCDE